MCIRDSFDTEYSFLSDMTKTLNDIKELYEEVDNSSVNNLIGKIKKADKIGK